MLSIFTGYFIELILLFLFVLAHELGHLLMAKQFAWKIKELKLLPFGGVLIVDDAHGTTAKEECLVACAGPIQNLILILLAWVFGQLHWLPYEWMQYMIQANMLLIIFNLLPISPLDGGKIVQAALSLVLSYFYTLKVITWLSIVCSFLMIVYALTYSVWHHTAGPQLNLLLVGIFLFSDNLTRLKHLPYLLYRFILHRGKMLKQMHVTESVNEAVPIIVYEEQTLFSLFKKIKRESHHLFYCITNKDKQVKVKTEQHIIESFINSSHLNRALIDIFD